MELGENLFLNVEAIIPRGFSRETDHRTMVYFVTDFAGQCPCPECGGTGDWTPFYPEPLPSRSLPCVECKGTGKIWVGV